MVKENIKANPVISKNLFQKMPNVFYYPIVCVAYQRSEIKEQSRKNSMEKEYTLLYVSLKKLY